MKIKQFLVAFAIAIASLLGPTELASAHSATEPYRSGYYIVSSVVLHAPAEVYYTVYATNEWVGGFGSWRRGRFTSLTPGVRYTLKVPCTYEPNAKYIWELRASGPIIGQSAPTNCK